MKTTYIQTKGYTPLKIGKLVDAYVVTDVIHCLLGMAIIYFIIKYWKEISAVIEIIRQYFML